jgi:hypothetical protein
MSFKQIDVTRAVKGVEQAGLTVADVVIRPDGTISIKIKADGPKRECAGWGEDA